MRAPTRPPIAVPVKSPATIPKHRYYENKKHLENLNVYEYNWKKTYGSNMEATDSEIVSPKIIRNRYHPLRF